MSSLTIELQNTPVDITVQNGNAVDVTVQNGNSIIVDLLNSLTQVELFPVPIDITLSYIGLQGPAGSGSGGVISLNSLVGALNLIAGSNITITPSGNGITISSSGGGGGGVALSPISISTNTNAGSTIGTWYVYYCTGTITLTLPTAVSNTNPYTVKNVGTGIITIATTSGQTIDDIDIFTQTYQNQANTFTSDNSNWNVIV